MGPSYTGDEVKKKKKEKIRPDIFERNCLDTKKKKPQFHLMQQRILVVHLSDSKAANHGADDAADFHHQCLSNDTIRLERWVGGLG